jgi:hypothetical protein
MLFRERFAAALLIAAMACAEWPSLPTDPAATPAPVAHGASAEQLRLERMARRIAQALANPAFRNQLRLSLVQSAHQENKVHLGRLLAEDGGRPLRDIAGASGDQEAGIRDDLGAAGTLELYLPVYQHRLRWNGGADILVATSLHDGDPPVAFDSRGNRYTLDPALPPATPVLSLVPAETDFSRPQAPNRATCTPETCPPGGGGGGSPPGGGGGIPPAPHGVYLTSTMIGDLREDWLRGSPEIEAMFMGPLTDTTRMTLIACSNESASSPRYYNQDNHHWTGNVLIADSAQLERVRAAYPPGTPWNLVRFTVAFWEDDTGRCQIAASTNSWKNRLIAAGLVVLGGMTVLTTDWGAPIDDEAWPFIAQLPLGLLGLIGTIGGNDDFIGISVNRSVWNPLHPDDQVSTTQVLLDGGTRTGTATLVWR